MTSILFNSCILEQQPITMRITTLLLLLPFIAFSQSLPSIEEKTKNLKRSDGYIPFYWDDAAGKIWLEINKTDTEILYYTSMPSAIGSNDIGLDRGRLAGIRIVKFNRVGRKLMMVQPNYDYRAITEDPAEKKAVEQSFAQSTLWGFSIEAESGNRYLVDATDFCCVMQQGLAASSGKCNRAVLYLINHVQPSTCPCRKIFRRIQNWKLQSPW